MGVRTDEPGLNLAHMADEVAEQQHPTCTCKLLNTIYSLFWLFLGVLFAFLLCRPKRFQEQDEDQA